MFHGTTNKNIRPLDSRLQIEKLSVRKVPQYVKTTCSKIHHQIYTSKDKVKEHLENEFVAARDAWIPNLSVYAIPMLNRCLNQRGGAQHCA